MSRTFERPLEFRFVRVGSASDFAFCCFYTAAEPFKGCARMGRCRRALFFVPWRGRGFVPVGACACGRIQIATGVCFVCSVAAEFVLRPADFVAQWRVEIRLLYIQSHSSESGRAKGAMSQVMMRVIESRVTPPLTLSASGGGSMATVLPNGHSPMPYLAKSVAIETPYTH